MDLSRVRAALTGIEEDHEPGSVLEYFPLQFRLLTPPSYFVWMLLRLVGFRFYQRFDKSEWQVYIRYRGVQFCLLDSKTLWWSIEATGNASQSHELEELQGIAESLRRRIEQACRRLDDVLEPELKRQVAAQNFALLNSFRHVHSLYDYFRSQVEDALAHLEVAKTSKSTSSSEWVEHVNEQLELERIASYNACAMIAFFFPYTDLIFDILFALFRYPAVSFQEFRSKSWRERFTFVLPLTQDRTLAQLYRQLLRMKQDWRDVPLHGFGGTNALLVPVPGIGLIPTSFEAISESVHFSHTPMREEQARQALETFVSFDDWLHQHEQTIYAVLYAQSGLEIPFNLERLGKIRSWMTSPESFQQSLDGELRAREYLRDQYQ